MRIQKKKNKKRTFLITLAIIAAGLLLAGGAAAYWWFVVRDQPNDSNVNYGPPTEQEKEQATQKKKEVIEEEQNKGEEPGQSPEISLAVTISRANQSAAGQPVNVRTLVNGTTEGTCTYTFTKENATTITKEFPIAFEATSAHCNGDVAVNEFSANGQWLLTIVARHDNKASEPTNINVTVTK